MVSLHVVVLGLALATAPVQAAPDPACREALLGKAYPLEGCASFPAALFHWLDSLTGLRGPGMTGGKTREAHRREFRTLFGAPDETDNRMLEGFARARVHHARTAGHGRHNDLANAFFEATTLDEALERTSTLIDAEHQSRLRSAVRHFAVHYGRIWNDGRVARHFLDRPADARRLEALSRFLVRVARFYGVSPKGEPTPRLILVPVRNGYGTHAQAVGRNLLLEIRDWEGLLDEVPPIVHENAHLLFHRMPRERLEALRDRAAATHARGFEAWQLLLEALPTAIAQGAAGQAFMGERWSIDNPWYHIDSVDAYAKTIFPLVRSRLENGGRLNEKFVQRLVEAYEP